MVSHIFQCKNTVSSCIQNLKNYSIYVLTQLFRNIKLGPLSKPSLNATLLPIFNAMHQLISSWVDIFTHIWIDQILMHSHPLQVDH